MCPREKGFVLWGHCQNLLDDPRMMISVLNISENRVQLKPNVTLCMKIKIHMPALVKPWAA